LEKDWLFKLGLKHESFRLLEKAYPHSKKETRTSLLERIVHGPSAKSTQKLKKRTREYAIYNLLVWLNKVDPNCPLATEQLKTMQQKYTDFAPREHPDKDFDVSVGWAAPQSPITTEEILKMDLPKKIDWLLSFQGEQPMGPDREGLLSKITEAVIQSFKFSWKLVLVLQGKNKWSSDIWRSILMGWQGSTLSEVQWIKLLTFLNENALQFSIIYQIADLIERGARKESGKLPLSCLNLAENLAIQLYSESVKKRGREGEFDEHDWLTSAINHSGGSIATFFLIALSMRRAEAKENWKGLRSQYKQYFRKILTGKSYAAQMGRIILVSQIHFLFVLDSDWTQKNILPLLDWNKESKQAEQAWHGYLSWGQWNDALLPQLLPFYIQTIPKLPKEISTLDERFCKHLADIALFSSINPIKHGWLLKFLMKANSNYRIDLARFIGYQLESLQSDSIENVWNRWMKNYWRKRIRGIPLLLDEDEKREMILWTSLLDPVFPEVVEEICSLSAPDFKQTRLYHKFVEKEFSKKYPHELVRLLRHLLSSASDPFYHCAEVEKLVQDIIGSAVPERELLNLCENLAKLGCSNAEQLKELIERNGAYDR